MKKIILLMLLFIFSTTAYAQKQEYIDKNYDFSKVKKVYFNFSYLPNANGINENETMELNTEAITKIWKQAKLKGYEFYGPANIIEMIKTEKQINIKELAKNDIEKANEIFMNYLNENMDVAAQVDVLVYDIGSQYREGYFMNVPSTETTYIYTPYGSGTMTTYGNEQQYVPGGNVPVAYCCVKMYVHDFKTDKDVWVRIDDRAKMNATVFDNTRPKDMYKRIINSYYGDFRKNVLKNL